MAAGRGKEGGAGGGVGRARRFLFDPRAYLMDPVVLRMTLEARGAYSTLLMHLWDMDEPGVVEDNEVVLGTLSRATPEEWGRVRDAVGAAFDRSGRPGWWVQKRMVYTHRTQQQWLNGKVEAGRRGGNAKARNAKASTPVAHPKQKGSGVGLGVGVGVEEAQDKDLATGGGRVGDQLALTGTPMVAAMGRAVAATAARAEWLEAFAEDFWPQYPRRVGKPRAVRAWLAIRPWSQQQVELVCAGLDRWVEHWRNDGTAKHHIPHPATWLNDERWNDTP